jgi:hypothetical protein
MHHSNRMPKVQRPSSRQSRPSSRQSNAGDPYPESDILREINKVHVQYTSDVDYQSDSRAPSRPVTAGKKEKKRVSSYEDRVPRLSSFSNRPVLQDIDVKVAGGDSKVVDPSMVTTLNTYKIEVIGESVKESKGRDDITLIFSITGLRFVSL